jgi:hypothetical protein
MAFGTDFGGDVQRFGKRYQSRLRAVARWAVQDTISLAQRVEKQGGHMRIDTGFLRASIQAALHTMPSGPVRPKKDAKKGEYTVQVAGENVSIALLRWDPNTSARLFVGWTANYARHREFQDDFLSSATEVWDQTVRRAAKKAAVGFG